MTFSRTFGDREVHVEGNIRHRQRREFIRISNLDEDGNIIDPEDSARRYVYELTRMRAGEGSDLLSNLLSFWRPGDPMTVTGTPARPYPTPAVGL